VALRYLGREMEYVLYPESWHTFAITAGSTGTSACSPGSIDS
jgi:hypothetical protein